MRFFAISILLTVSICCLPTTRLAAQQPSVTDAGQSYDFAKFIQESAARDSENNEAAWEPLEIEEEESESPWDEPIETDRHDFTQSPRVVGRGVRQFEYGILYTNRQEGSEVENSYATPELLFRYGLNDRLELRTRFNYAWKQISDDDDFDGGEDLRLSIKYQVSDHCGWRPDSALELRSSAPTGGESMTTGRWQFGVDYIYGWELGEYFTFAGSSGANGNALGDVAFIDPDADPEDGFVAWTQSFALGARLTERTTGYFEWFGIFTDGREEEASLSFLNFGVDYLINKNLVIDARIGWGLTPESDDVFAGLGGGFRF